MAKKNNKFQSFEEYRQQSRKKKLSDFINIGTGMRYVFFESLGSQRSKAKQQIYKQLRAQGEGLVNNAAAALAANQDRYKDLSQLQKIQNYIELIGQAASNELKLQHTFLSKLMAKTKDKALQAFINKNKDLIDPNNANFDYTTFIVAINKFSTQIDEFTKKRKKILLDNAKLIEDNINDQASLSENIRNQLNEAMSQGYGQFQKKLREFDLLKTRNKGQDNEQKFSSGLHNIIARKLTTILNQISKDRSVLVNLEASIIELFGGQAISNDNIAKQITAAILDYLLHDVEDVEKASTEELKKGFLKTYQQTKRIYTDKEIEEITNIIINKTVKPIEYQALVTQKNVGDLFSSLDSIAQNDIIKEYQEEYGLNRSKVMSLLQSLKANVDNTKKAAGIKGHLTRLLKQAIFKKYQGFQELTLKARKEKLNQLLEQGKMFFSATTLEQSLSNALQVRIQDSALSQHLQAQLMSKVTNLIAKNGLAKALGTTIKMKTDIGITYKLGELKGLDNREAIENIETQLNNFTNDFVTQYSNKTKNQINVDIAKETYLQQRKRIVDKIREQAEKQSIDPKEAIESLENFFFTEVSQKEYVKGGNFGFESGSLGGGGAPQAVINNIISMYETGGISPADKELLYFAAINCSSAALGASLKIPLQQYLLGGAALMMFDSGFTATTNFLQQMKNYLGIGNTQGSLHLFSLQGGNLVPASYLYSSIYNALISAYQGIVAEVEKPLYETAIKQGSAGNRVTITNNISNQDIPHFTEVPNAGERWDYVSGIAASSVNISFTFLGGMLDIFEAIANAFNV